MRVWPPSRFFIINHCAFTERRTGSFDFAIGAQLASSMPVLGIFPVCLFLAISYCAYRSFKKRHNHREVFKAVPKKAKTRYRVGPEGEEASPVKHVPDPAHDMFKGPIRAISA